MEPKFLDRFTSGLLVGAIFSIVCFWLFTSELDEKIVDRAFDFGEYLVAISAAFLALRGIRQQIEANRSEQLESRQRELIAARALLPLALTEFIKVTRRGMDLALKNDDFYNDAENLEIVSNDLELNPEIISILRDCIMPANRNNQRWISICIARYQVARSRLLGSIGDPNLVVTDHNRMSLAFDWAVLHALVEHLFEFARGGDGVEEHLNLENIHLPINLAFGSHQLSPDAVTYIVEQRSQFGDGSVSNFEFVD